MLLYWPWFFPSQLVKHLFTVTRKQQHHPSCSTSDPRLHNILNLTFSHIFFSSAEKERKRSERKRGRERERTMPFYSPSISLYLFYLFISVSGLLLLLLHSTQPIDRSANQRCPTVPHCVITTPSVFQACPLPSHLIWLLTFLSQYTLYIPNWNASSPNLPISSLSSDRRPLW